MWPDFFAAPGGLGDLLTFALTSSEGSSRSRRLDKTSGIGQFARKLRIRMPIALRVPIGGLPLAKRPTLSYLEPNGDVDA